MAPRAAHVQSFCPAHTTTLQSNTYPTLIPSLICTRLTLGIGLLPALLLVKVKVKVIPQVDVGVVGAVSVLAGLSLCVVCVCVCVFGGNVSRVCGNCIVIIT